MKKEWIPIAIVGGLSLALIGVGIYFRKQLKEVATYIFTDNITYHLKQLNPAVQKKFAQFIAKIQAMGYKVQINSSYRSILRQSQIKYNANDPTTKTMYSVFN
mgnify:CR=1 FL=1